MSKILDNVTWPKATLFGGIIMLVTFIFSPETAERFYSWILEIVQTLSNAVRGVGG